MKEHRRLWLIGMALVAGTACGRLNPFNLDALDGGDGVDTGPGHLDSGFRPPDDPGDSEVAPELLTFNVRQTGDRIEVSFRTADPDGDLEGGTLELKANGTSMDLAIPGDIDHWAPNGESKLFFPTSPCDGGQTRSFTGQLVDSAGNRSERKSGDVTIGGSARQIPETGNDAFMGAYDAGYIYPPTFLCGSIDSMSDEDWIVFDPPEPGLYTLTLTWEQPGADYDLYLQDLFGLLYNESSATPGTAQPEVIETLLFPNDIDGFYIGIKAASGPSGRWMLEVDN